MGNLDSKTVERALLKKGFSIEMGDHKYFRLYLNGKDTGVYTKTSHNSQDIGDMLTGKMAKQLRMNTMFFKAFVECAKTQKDYETLLREQNVISDEE
jgi:hypothetical protein